MFNGLHIVLMGLYRRVNALLLDTRNAFSSPRGNSVTFLFIFVRPKDAALIETGWRSFTAVEVPEFEGFSSGMLFGSRFVHVFVARVALILAFSPSPFCR